MWARGSDNENAVGNLVLHLTGNIRQWIGFGIGGWENVRDRDSEFRARGGMPLEDLQMRLRVGVDEALSIITQLTPERLAETTNVQGYDVTVLQAVYHVVEHFAQHTGQIIFITKMLDFGGPRLLRAPRRNQAQRPDAVVYFECSSASSPCSTMSPDWNRMPLSVSRHFGFWRSRNSRSMPKCLNSSCCAFCMIFFASRSFSTEMRCSYQLIASASSVSDTIMRANVRVSSESSDGGS